MAHGIKENQAASLPVCPSDYLGSCKLGACRCRLPRSGLLLPWLSLSISARACERRTNHEVHKKHKNSNQRFPLSTSGHCCFQLSWQCIQSSPTCSLMAGSSFWATDIEPQQEIGPNISRRPSIRYCTQDWLLAATYLPPFVQHPSARLCISCWLRSISYRWRCISSCSRWACLSWSPAVTVTVTDSLLRYLSFRKSVVYPDCCVYAFIISFP